MGSSGTCRELWLGLAPLMWDTLTAQVSPADGRRAGLVLPTAAFREGVVDMEPPFRGTQRDMNHDRCCPTVSGGTFSQVRAVEDQKPWAPQTSTCKHTRKTPCQAQPMSGFLRKRQAV